MFENITAEIQTFAPFLVPHIPVIMAFFFGMLGGGAREVGNYYVDCQGCRDPLSPYIGSISFNSYYGTLAASATIGGIFAAVIAIFPQPAWQFVIGLTAVDFVKKLLGRQS